MKILTSRAHRSTVLKVLGVLVLALLVGLGVGAVARADGPNRAAPGTLAAASSVLGGPVPQPYFLPAGMKLKSIGIDAAGNPVRAVHLSYGTDTRSLILMTVTSQGVRAADADERMVLDGHEVQVSTKQLSDATTDVAYVWNLGRYGIVLHVNLSNGIDRRTADQIATSVR